METQDWTRGERNQGRGAKDPIMTQPSGRRNNRVTCPFYPVDASRAHRGIRTRTVGPLKTAPPAVGLDELDMFPCDADT